MRSRRRRLQRQRRKKFHNGGHNPLPRKHAVQDFRVWGRPIGCFDNANKLRKEER